MNDKEQKKITSEHDIHDHSFKLLLPFFLRERMTDCSNKIKHEQICIHIMLVKNIVRHLYRIITINIETKKTG